MPPFQTQTIQLLLERAVEKAQTTMDYSGLETLSDRINEVAQESLGVEVSRKYLYDNVYCQIKKAIKSRQQQVFLSRMHLNAIALFLGFRDIIQFLQKNGYRFPNHFAGFPEAGSNNLHARSGTDFVASEPEVTRTPIRVSQPANPRLDYTAQSQMGIAHSGITVLGGTVSIDAQNIAGRDLVFQSPLGQSA